MEYRSITPQEDAAVAALIRGSLEKRGLNIPGTAYCDPGLDHLSDYYAAPGRAYYVLTDGNTVIGGVGLAEFDGDCCELQKLYLAEERQGRGLSYEMIRFIEEKAREMGYRRIYLETHTGLQAAIHVYERAGYRQVPKPASVVHSAMDRFYIREL